jgi:hypothetical protein
MVEALWKRNREAGEGWLAVDLNLNCGEVWRDPPEDVAALAFLLPGEDPAALRQFDGGGA